MHTKKRFSNRFLMIIHNTSLYFVKDVNITTTSLKTVLETYNEHEHESCIKNRTSL